MDFLKQLQKSKLLFIRLLTKRAIAALVILSVAATVLTRGAPNYDLIKTATAQEKTITSEVSAPGTVKSETSSVLKFSFSGKIAWIGVSSGDSVYKGQAIASLDKEPFEIALRIASQQVNATDAVLSQVYDEQKKQTAAENFDQKIRRTNAESAKNQAYDNMKKAEFDLANSTIYSPQDGVISNIKFVTGEQVTPASEIAQINDLSNLNFIAQMDETDIAKVKVGQKAEITLDAYPNNTIETKVEKISPVAITSTTGATAYEVNSHLQTAGLYYIGMNGQSQVITSEKPNVITIPLDAIVNEKYVWAKVGNTYVKGEIQTGIESDTETEVVFGLENGLQVVTSGFDQIGKRSLLQRIISIFPK